MGSPGRPQAFLFFLPFLFDYPRRASNRLGKWVIYCDPMSEAVVKNASVKYFCPSRLMIFVVVLGGHLGGSFAAITSDVWPPSAARNYLD